MLYLTFIQNTCTLNDFNKIIQIYILFSTFIFLSLFFVTAFFFSKLIYFLLAWICPKNFTMLLSYFCVFNNIAFLQFLNLNVHISHGKFSIFIWKIWKSQEIFKFIFCGNSEVYYLLNIYIMNTLLWN